MTSIITHRGLDPSKPHFFAESSVEAFKDQLLRGYGIEFDLRITKDRKIVVIHDDTLSRVSNGNDKRKVNEVDSEEILSMNLTGSHITTFDKVLDLIDNIQFADTASAIHLKSGLQNALDLELIVTYLVKRDTSKFFIFDTRIEAAQFLKKHIPSLRIAPSVAHSFDIERFNPAVGGTLLSIEETLENCSLFEGVWLDEWDLSNKNNEIKKLYTQEVFKVFKEKGLWIGLVSPELHGTSPGLLGAETHPDAAPFEKLAERMAEIVKLKPDAICTDYPDYVYKLVQENLQ